MRPVEVDVPPEMCSGEDASGTAGWRPSASFQPRAEPGADERSAGRMPEPPVLPERQRGERGCEPGGEACELAGSPGDREGEERREQEDGVRGFYTDHDPRHESGREAVGEGARGERAIGEGGGEEHADHRGIVGERRETDRRGKGHVDVRLRLW